MGSNLKWATEKVLCAAVAAISTALFFLPLAAGPHLLVAVSMVLSLMWLLVGSPFKRGHLTEATAGAAMLDMPAAGAMLKEHYDDQKVENVSQQKNVALAMVPKNADCEGKYVPFPTIYEVSQGISSTFSDAQGNQAPSQFVEFLVPLRPDYSISSITEQARVSSGSNVGAFLKMAKAVYDGALQGSAKSANSALYRSGSGSVSQIGAAGVTNGVIPLANPADVVQFAINQVLQANTTDGGTPLATLGYVIARNTVAGTVTVSATAQGGPAGTPVGWVAGQYLLRKGDNNAKITGWDAWLPLTAPTASDNFYGVNRSPDSRLYGLAYPGQQQSIEEALIDCSMFVAREGGEPRHHFTNWGTQAALIKALGARCVYVNWQKDEAQFGFQGVKFQGPQGIIESYADYCCPAVRGLLLQLDTWELLSVGGAVPHIKKYQDGIEMFRISNADAMELRAGYFANLAGRAPGWNAQIQFGA